MTGTPSKPSASGQNYINLSQKPTYGFKVFAALKKTEVTGVSELFNPLNESLSLSLSLFNKDKEKRSLSLKEENKDKERERRFYERLTYRPKPNFRNGTNKLLTEARDALAKRCADELNAADSLNFFYKTIWKLGMDETRELLALAQLPTVQNPKAYFLASAKRRMLVKGVE